MLTAEEITKIKTGDDITKATRHLLTSPVAWQPVEHVSFDNNEQNFQFSCVRDQFKVKFCKRHPEDSFATYEVATFFGEPQIIEAVSREISALNAKLSAEIRTNNVLRGTALQRMRALGMEKTDAFPCNMGNSFIVNDDNTRMAFLFIPRFDREMLATYCLQADKSVDAAIKI